MIAKTPPFIPQIENIHDKDGADDVEVNEDEYDEEKDDDENDED